MGLEVREHGVVGSYVCGAQPAPGAVVLGGSEGGRPRCMAELLAASGYSALALSYFGEPGLPRRLVDVPVDRVAAAVAWLRDRPEVMGDRVAAVGASKGAELALVAAAFIPDEIGAVVAYAPSAVVFEGIGFSRRARHRSSWTWQGEPLPFVPYPRPMRPSVGLRGIKLRPIYAAALDDRAAAERAVIPIERSHAPILLLSGGRDGMWPSTDMAEMVVGRLAAAGRPAQATHVQFDQAGHSFMPWRSDMRLRPVGDMVNSMRLAGFGGAFDLGGRPAANRAALHEAWRCAVDFLDEVLKPHDATSADSRTP